MRRRQIRQSTRSPGRRWTARDFLGQEVDTGGGAVVATEKGGEDLLLRVRGEVLREECRGHPAQAHRTGGERRRHGGPSDDGTPVLLSAPRAPLLSRRLTTTTFYCLACLPSPLLVCRTAFTLLFAASLRFSFSSLFFLRVSSSLLFPGPLGLLLGQVPDYLD